MSKRTDREIFIDGVLGHVKEELRAAIRQEITAEDLNPCGQACHHMDLAGLEERLERAHKALLGKLYDMGTQDKIGKGLLPIILLKLRGDLAKQGIYD